jgi:hypothetical protein
VAAAAPEEEEPMRNLSKEERIRARHLLQELSEAAKSVRNAMDPQHGMLALSVHAWEGQWASLTDELDYFTAQLSKVHDGSREGNAPRFGADENDLDGCDE